MQLPGFAPTGALLSFASPKESKQRKGDPAATALRASLTTAALDGYGCELAPTALKQQPCFFRPKSPLFGVAEGKWGKPPELEVLVATS